MALVVVHMGHCFRRRGATGTPGEQLFAKRAADACQRVLTQRGHRIRAVRADDPEVTYRGDAFVSLHCDGSIDPDARGAAVGYESTCGRMIARAYVEALARYGWRGFRPDNYTSTLKHDYAVRMARGQGVRHAFLASAGFLTNSVDRAILTSEEGPVMVAESLADAVDQVVGRGQQAG